MKNRLIILFFVIFFSSSIYSPEFVSPGLFASGVFPKTIQIRKFDRIPKKVKTSSENIQEKIEEFAQITNMYDNQKSFINYKKLSAESIRVLLAVNKYHEILKRKNPQGKFIVLAEEAKLALEILYFKKCSFMQKLEYKILGIPPHEGDLKKLEENEGFGICQNILDENDHIVAFDSESAMQNHIKIWHKN